MNFDIFSNVFNLTNETSKRASSWDKKGGNQDGIRIGSKKTAVLADIEGPGIIKHIYVTMILPDPRDFRSAILRMYWDDEENPSVEVPLGDFFCVSNCRLRQINSMIVTVNKGMPGCYGLNAFFPMPFSKHAKIEIENQGNAALGGYNRALWFHIDYIKLNKPFLEDVGYFHAFWNRETLTRVSEEVPKEKKNLQDWKGINLSGKDNYVILDIEGDGKVVGLVLNIDNLSDVWYGEGDDMIFIDDDTWPPSLHGTGTEEVFGGGACPQTEYCTPYAGFHLIENRNFAGNNAMYRWFINDSIRFKKRIKWTIEHGHANNFENDYSSVAYWYQKEPHNKFLSLLELEARMPRFPENYEELRDKMTEVGLKTYALLNKLKDKFPEELELLGLNMVDNLIKINMKKAIPNYYKLKKAI
jgi:hypothetical protein